MNRAIRSRGKSIFGVHEWLYGSLLLLNGKTYICPNKSTTWDMAQYEVIPETVGQFTNFFDNNGKEIYEGDIIRMNLRLLVGSRYYRNKDFLVKYKNGVFILKDLSTSNFVCDQMLLSVNYDWFSVLIICNIHDNLKLINS